MQWSDWSQRFSIPLQLLIVFLFCTLVGLFLSAINIGSHRSDLLINLAISYLIGFSIWAIERVLRLWRWIESTQLRALVAIVAGAVAGGGAGGWIFLDHLGKLESFRGELLRILLLGLVFGALSLYIIYTQTTLHRRREQLAAEREQRVEQERQLTQSRLDHLQAQIEPHFLFNTLANIHSRIESAPDEARMMMEHLTQILRGRLDSSGHEITLGEEMALIEEYLAIQQLRLGERLHCRIVLEPMVADRTIPALLIQPLVENAITHGIEPEVTGGMLVIRAEGEEGRLLIDVADDGVGLGNSPRSGSGVALNNIRQRLSTRYGAAAQLNITTRDGWTRSTITLPQQEVV